MKSIGKNSGRGNALPGVYPRPIETESRAAPGPYRGSRPPAVICDFDDTTAVENVASLLLEHFSEDSSWQVLRRQSRENEISLKEYQERAFNATRAGREAMQAVVKGKATLRPYFKELWQYCRSKDVPLAIVTVGLDFYVEALLEREGLQDVPSYAVKTRFTPEGITYEYPHCWDGSGASSFEVCSRWGNCKCSVLAGYKKRGYSILYVGDGRSDYCPASTADHIFARSYLADVCRENQVEYTEFQDFSDVIRELEGWAGRHDPGEPGPRLIGETG